MQQQNFVSAESFLQQQQENALQRIGSESGRAEQSSSEFVKQAAKFVFTCNVFLQ